MLQNIRQISILNKIFNVHGSEWPRIGMSWLIGFLYRTSFVIGWTVIVAMFVSKFSISALPYLFIANAVFIILGSLLYSTFIDHFRKESILVATVFIAAAFLMGGYFFFDKSQILFFGLLIVAEALFLGQFRIILHGFIEEMFTPLQSERTFPLIGSYETIGGIVAGLAVVSLADINIENFILIWVIILALIVPCMFIYQSMNKDISHYAVKDPLAIGFITKLKREMKNLKGLSFIKGLFFIVLFQWILFNLLEFQYTKAIYQNVSEVLLDSGSGFQHALVHDLGEFFILFSASALLIQLFVGSRLMTSLGVIGSMLLHPIVTLLSLFGLTMHYSLPTAILAKNNFTITSEIHLTAYHCSYYAIRERFREHVREFLDGFVKPVGALLGTFILIVLQKFFIGEHLVFAINFSMLVAALGLFYVTYILQFRYTRAALEDLMNSKDKKVRLNAIDILAQRGHRKSLDILRKILVDKKEPIYIRTEILRALAELHELSVVPDIVTCFKSKRIEVRRAALDSLLRYKSLFRGSSKHLVIDCKLIEELKSMYRGESDEEIRSMIVRLLSKISTVSTFEFLISVLKTAHGKLKADTIYALGNYTDLDVVAYIRPYLKASDYRQKTAAVVSIGRFSEYKEEALGMIATFLNSGNTVLVSDALFAIGELKIKKKRNICRKYMESKNINIRLNSAYALAKMGYPESAPVLAELMVRHGRKIRKKVELMIKNVDVRIYKILDRIAKDTK